MECGGPTALRFVLLLLHLHLHCGGFIVLFLYSSASVGVRDWCRFYEMLHYNHYGEGERREEHALALRWYISSTRWSPFSYCNSQNIRPTHYLWTIQRIEVDLKLSLTLSHSTMGVLHQLSSGVPLMRVEIYWKEAMRGWARRSPEEVALSMRSPSWEITLAL